MWDPDSLYVLTDFQYILYLNSSQCCLLLTSISIISSIPADKWKIFHPLIFCSDKTNKSKSLQYLRLNLMHSLFRYILGTQLCQEIIFFHKQFEANRSRGSRDKIGHANKLDTQRLIHCICGYAYAN